MNSKARISAVGSYVPEKRLTNSDLERLVETNDEWIVQRTGMRERRIAAPGEYTSHMCISAIDNMIAEYGVALEDVDLILTATNTPDLPFPTVSCLVQAHFGIPSTGALDLNATCAGFVYALHTANAFITAGLHRKILVLGADHMSAITDYTDRTTCILLGDGAGAALVEAAPGDAPGAFLGHHLGSDGTGGVHLYRTGLADRIGEKALDGAGKLVQNGREVYKFAVGTVPKGVSALLDSAGMTMSGVDWFIPHSANLRIIESLCERMDFPVEKTLYSLEYYGNTSAATIPLSLHMGLKEGKIKPGDLLLLYGFGGGLVHGGLLVRWG
ncbi:ketoacyl-ACP synthase III [Paenibacillus sp. UNC499MF]|uniref:ketoacyl-ACP synthase III n=1 Tax=Paenibacillus sp. UNC499MF TaxID=1502751 RepID=UPI0008A06A24|nr:ketoacyl-ACP synthase III [Paenibacillus sp. UNC499MF]SEG36171.1 3-oxoacyl-[acyl-carrier-protein] synthase-3 [Paenibacillus sp. UNC499MF]